MGRPREVGTWARETKQERDRGAERDTMPRKTRRSQKRNQRINWSQHTQRETRGEGETSQKRLRSLTQEGGGAGTEWEGDPAEKERETEMERAFRFRGGVPCED